MYAYDMLKKYCSLGTQKLKVFKHYISLVRLLTTYKYFEILIFFKYSHLCFHDFMKINHVLLGHLGLS